MRKLVKTKEPVVVDARTGVSEVLYFEKVAEQRDDFAIFKGQVGLYAYLIKVYVMVNGNLVPANKIEPIQAVYKLSTWLNLFGDLTPNKIVTQEQELLIQQIDYNSRDYWGLTSDDLEPFNYKDNKTQQKL